MPGGYGHRLAVLEISKSLTRETPDSPKAEIANAVNADNKANPQMAVPAHGVSGPFGYHLQYTTARLPRAFRLEVVTRPHQFALCRQAAG
jgi:hypothetical protein